MSKLVVANWKMYLTLSQSVALAKKFTVVSSQFTDLKLVLCPSFVALEEVGKLLKVGGGSRPNAPEQSSVRGRQARTIIALGAQDVEPEKRGAFTGEVGLDDLTSLRVQYVLVGHSERRRMGETDAVVNKKLRAVLGAKMRPILCVGEPQGVRKQGMNKVRRYVGKQVRRGLKQVKAQDLKRVVIAYEPIWAIGTGKPDMPEDASEMHGWIRKIVDGMYGGLASGPPEARPLKIPILYGGSVNYKNAADFLQSAEVNGLLIGRASTQAAEFKKIVSSL